MPDFTLEVGKLNNKQDPIKLGGVDFKDPTLTTVIQAQNFDIDSNGLAVCRRGRTQVHAGAAHSFWVHPFNKALAYFVKPGGLYRLNADYSGTLVAQVNANLKGSFEVVGASVVFSNEEQIGWVDRGSFTAFDQGLISAEERTPAGQLIAFDHTDNVLLVASGGVLYKSKPYNVEVADGRLNKFPFDGYVRMIATVEDGWWLATDRRVGFVTRSGAEEYTYTHVSDVPPPTGCFTAGWEESESGSRRFVAWASSDGFCVGRAGGQYKNLSEGVALPDGRRGTVFNRVVNGVPQLVAVIYDPVYVDKFVPPTLVVNSITVS